MPTFCMFGNLECNTKKSMESEGREMLSWNGPPVWTRYMILLLRSYVQGVLHSLSTRDSLIINNL